MPRVLSKVEIKLIVTVEIKGKKTANEVGKKMTSCHKPLDNSNYGFFYNLTHQPVIPDKAHQILPYSNRISDIIDKLRYPN